MPTYEQIAPRAVGISRDRQRTVFGQVMGLVALTVGFAALGAYIGRNLNASFVLMLAPLACVIGLNVASARGHEQLAIGLLFALGLLLGIAVGGVIHYYAATQPTAVYQAAGTTALGVAALGIIGYTTRRDLSAWARPLLFALIALIVFGLIATLVAVPGGHIIYCVAGLGVFSLLTIFDFNRLSKSGMASAPVIAASIFLDVFNIFLLLLSLFGGGGRR
ncbi:MAG: Bax inhibitor-1/YccA family protein [Solirubrobacteraceae bacterium]